MQLIKNLAALSVLFLMTSCATFGKSGATPNDAAFCSSSAFVELEEYNIPNLQTADEGEFKLWVTEYITKYPELKKAYALLLECWQYYHVKE